MRKTTPPTLYAAITKYRQGGGGETWRRNLVWDLYAMIFSELSPEDDPEFMMVKSAIDLNSDEDTLF